MDKRLHRLETFSARGSDGRIYQIDGFEHLARVDLVAAAAREQWEPTGQVEYKLADGRPLHVEPQGEMRVIGTDLLLRRA